MTHCESTSDSFPLETTQPQAHDAHGLTHERIVPGEAVWLEILSMYAELVSYFKLSWGSQMQALW